MTALPYVDREPEHQPRRVWRFGTRTTCHRCRSTTFTRDAVTGIAWCPRCIKEDRDG